MLEIFEKLRLYNPWGENDFSVGFLRKNYLSKIRKFQNNHLIKVLIGQRRSGKSYLMRQIIQKLISEKIPKKTFFISISSFVDLIRFMKCEIGTGKMFQ